MLCDVVNKIRGEADLVIVPLPELPVHIIGVYFLMRGDKCVYIGSSTNILERINTHVSDAAGNGSSEPKLFDSAAYIQCDEHDLAEVEERFIAELQPEYNSALEVFRKPRQESVKRYSAEEHHKKLSELKDIALGFLIHTNEDGIAARDLYSRSWDRVRYLNKRIKQLGLVRFIRILSDDPRFSFDSQSNRFRAKK